MKFTTNTASKAGKNSSRKGVPNRSTNEIKAAFKDLIDNNMDNMQEWLDRVADDNPEKALLMVIKLSEYVIPKLNRTQLNQYGSSNPVHIFELPDNGRDKEWRKTRIKELVKKAQDAGIAD